jgi:hypothetical protein
VTEVRGRQDVNRGRGSRLLVVTRGIVSTRGRRRIRGIVRTRGRRIRGIVCTRGRRIRGIVCAWGRRIRGIVRARGRRMIRGIVWSWGLGVGGPRHHLVGTGPLLTYILGPP